MTKPNSLVVDVTSSHQPGMVYVMFSRVCSMEQLVIVDQMDPEKIRVNDKVKAEAARMEKISVNKNPCNWMNPATEGLKVCSLNTRSLRKHVEDVASDPVLLQSSILCLQETWLEDGEEKQARYQLEGYQGYFASEGSGKGVAVYVREGLEFESIHKFAEPNIQLCKIVMKKLDVITIYRSQDEPLFNAAHYLRNYCDPEKDTLIVGDVNICATKNNALSNFLEGEGFYQLVTLPTHIKGGIYQKLTPLRCVVIYPCTWLNPALSGILDQAHLRRTDVNVMATPVKTYSHYFSDHDSVTCIL